MRPIMKGIKIKPMMKVDFPFIMGHHDNMKLIYGESHTIIRYETL
jgi:hypothetical protein